VTKHEADPAERKRPGLPIWLWMFLLTAAIVAMLLYVGRNSFAA
jgi:type VI protein secretion system component VasF